MSTVAAEPSKASGERRSASVRFGPLMRFVSGCRCAVMRLARTIRPTRTAAVTTVWIPAPPRGAELIG